MHDVAIRPHPVEQALARCGRLDMFRGVESFDPARTVLAVTDMQNSFAAPGPPVEVPAGRGIIDNIDRLAAGLARLSPVAG